MFSIRPGIARLMGKVRAPRPITWEGFPREELHPASVLERSTALTLPDEYERIISAVGTCSLPDWIAEALGGPEPIAPTFRYELGPALVADGAVYYRGGFEVMDFNIKRPIARGTPMELKEAQLASYNLTENFFGHWLMDGSLLLLLAEQLGVTALTPHTHVMETWEHRKGYADILNSPSVSPQLAIVDKLWFVDDRPRNAGRGARLREMRARYRKGVPSAGSQRVFIRRGLSGALIRHLINEDDICELLATQYGFDIIDPPAMTAAEIAQSLANAKLVMGIEGSHLSHAVACASDDCLIFPIMPPESFVIAFKWYTDIIDMRFGFTVADKAGDAFHLPLDRLHRAMELIQRGA